MPDSASSGRLDLVESASTHPAIKAAFDAIRARGAEPLNLHRTIAHAPSLLAPFLDLAFALRAAPATPRVDRELIILRTAQLCNSDYVLTHHVGMGEASGLTAEHIHDLADWHDSDRFNERQRAILGYADAMFGPEGVQDSTFSSIERLLSEGEIVELTLTAAFYSGIARFARALGVPLEPDAASSDYGRT